MSRLRATARRAIEVVTLLGLFVLYLVVLSLGRVLDAVKRFFRRLLTSDGSANR